MQLSTYRAAIMGLAFFSILALLPLAGTMIAQSNAGQVVSSIKTGTNPFVMIYDPSNGYIYVANFGSITISVITHPSMRSRPT